MFNRTWDKHLKNIVVFTVKWLLINWKENWEKLNIWIGKALRKIEEYIEKKNDWVGKEGNN